MKGILTRLFGAKSDDPELKEIRSEKELAAQLRAQYPSGLPRVSIVSILYRKAYAIPMFLEAIFRQSYAGPIEIIFVGDKSPDRSIATARKTFRALKASAGAKRSEPVTMRLLTNEEQLGNCASLNVGLEKAAGDIVILADADCLFNKLFIGHHVLALAGDFFDLSTGPGLKAGGKIPPAKELLRYEKNPAQMLEDATLPEAKEGKRVSSGDDLHVFCDCRTRNLCARKSRLPTPLFDVALTQGTGSPHAKGCVEGADMGLLLEDRANLKLTWTPGAFTLRLIEPEFIDTPDDDEDFE